MAQFPCDRCGSRFRGGARYAYPCVLRGTSAVRDRTRLCPSCAEDLARSIWSAFPQLDSYGAYTTVEDSGCLICSAPRELGNFAFFMTDYLEKDERRDCYATLCATHGAGGVDAVMTWLWYRIGATDRLQPQK